jgi:hypothetical protein
MRGKAGQIGSLDLILAGVFLSLASFDLWADTHEDKAQQAVEAMPCSGATVASRLEEVSHTHSRRDLGWRFFSEGENLVVERAFRVSKSMEVKYRWQVDHALQVKPVSDTAQSLCQP